MYLSHLFILLLYYCTLQAVKSAVTRGSFYLLVLLHFENISPGNVFKLAHLGVRDGFSLLLAHSNGNNNKDVDNLFHELSIQASSFFCMCICQRFQPTMMPCGHTFSKQTFQWLVTKINKKQGLLNHWNAENSMKKNIFTWRANQTTCFDSFSRISSWDFLQVV